MKIQGREAGTSKYFGDICNAYYALIILKCFIHVFYVFHACHALQLSAIPALPCVAFLKEMTLLPLQPCHGVQMQACIPS